MNGVVNIVVLGMGAIALILGYMGYKIKFKKSISSIPAINDERLKKIKKIDKVCDDFGNRLFGLAILALITAVATYFFGNIGKWIGVVIFVLAVLNWNVFCGQIDEKIKKRIY